MFEQGRAICGDLTIAREREWLVTNGIGGFACGTIAGLLTRRYHGLLVAALRPPLGRTLLLAKLDETASYDGQSYPLSVNHWASGAINPAGYLTLERFHLEGTTPVWSYALGDALLEKRVWMPQGENTTYIQYIHRRGGLSLDLTAKVLVNYRDYHGTTHADALPLNVEQTEHGLRVATPGAEPFYVSSATAAVAPEHDWYRGYYLSAEAERGLDAVEDHLYAGTFAVTLRPGEAVTLVASVAANASLDGEAAYATRRAYERDLLARSGWADAPAPLQHLVLAADQFIAQRATPAPPTGGAH